MNEGQPHSLRRMRWAEPDLLILALLIAFPSTGFVQKYTGLGGVAAYVSGVIAALFLIKQFGGHFEPWLRKYFRRLTILAVAGLVVGFAVLHPLEDGRGGSGKSSDRDEGLNLAVTRMADGLSPYYPQNPDAGPLSLLPGAAVLAAPFVALGDSSYQNIFWVGAFLFAACYFFKDNALALILTFAPLALSPAAQFEFISGGDLIANGIYMTLFLLLVTEVWFTRTAPWPRQWLVCLLLGVAMASRPNFFLLMPLLAAVLYRRAGFPKAVTGISVVMVAAIGITLPFYLHDPQGFTPLLARQKLAVIDHSLPWASKAMIGLTALTGILGGLALLRHPSSGLNQAFFRWCAWVTLCPMVCAVASLSVINQHLDFGFNRDRYGLMYLFFALLGWGGILRSAESRLSEVLRR